LAYQSVIIHKLGSIVVQFATTTVIRPYAVSDDRLNIS